MAFDIDQELREFSATKNSQKYRDRNYTYWLLREAMKDRFRWPKDWPSHKPQLVINLVRAITLRSAALLMGKGFEFQVPPLVETPDERVRAQAVERILYRLNAKSGEWALWSRAAKDASLLGNAVLKVYIDPKDKTPKVSKCYPDYFYGFPVADNVLEGLAKVFYVHYLDPLSAERKYGDKRPPGKKFRDEGELSQEYQGDISGRNFERRDDGTRRRIPVLEIWTDEDYALIVGGVTIYNGENPYGFVPYTTIPNVSIDGEIEGLGDGEAVLMVNEELNQLISSRSYIIKRWMNPTLIWPAAPQDYASKLAAILGGGGALPVRLGSEPKFLEPANQGPDVLEHMERLRAGAMENANTNDLALNGNVQGSINTGPSVDKQFLPVEITIEDKRRNWETGIKRVVAQILELTQNKGAAKEYGAAFISTTGAKADGETIPLKPDVVGDYRDCKVQWPDAMPGADPASRQFELDKFTQGVQSLETTLERLGFDFPKDEMERLRQERSDPDLHPENAAKMLDAQAPLAAKQLDLQAQGFLPTGEEAPPGEEALPAPPAQAPARSGGTAPAPIGPGLAYNGDEPVIQ